MRIKANTRIVQSNIGDIEIIDTRRKCVPAGLRKPYEYSMTTADCVNLYEELRELLKPWQASCQFASVQRKLLTRGIRLNVFVLAYTPGRCGDTAAVTGVRRLQWRGMCKQLENVLINFLGADAQMYADPYSTSDKFQARFETYIAYQ